MRCVRCGIALPDEVKFCPSCGLKVQAGMICSVCGKKIAGGHAFCINCGALAGTESQGSGDKPKKQDK